MGDHHVVPAVKGGTKTVPLCLECHAKVYGMAKMAHSELTREGLRAYKARGGLLGAHRPGDHRLTGGANPEAAKRAGEVARGKADAAYEKLWTRLLEMRSGGMSLREISLRLNKEGLLTRRGCAWNPTQVMRVLKRFGERSEP